MKKPILIIIFLFAAVVAAKAQTVTVTQETADKAANCFATAESRENEKAALEAELAAIKKELAAAESEIIALREKSAADEAAKANQEKLIEIYKKKAARKVSILFGLIKIHY